MFIKKRQKSEREVIEQRKKVRNEMDPGREGWMMSSYNKFQVIAISGTDSINVMDVSRDGQFKVSSCAAKAPGRIISFRDDFDNNYGIIMNLDESAGNS